MGLQVGLNSARAFAAFALAVPVAFGLWSMALGADQNWDLYNYHLYNPFAFLNGKGGVDLAPGGLQNFFNPLLDLPYYLAVTHLPGPLVGFLMGALHGLDFVLLALICRRVLADLPERDAYRTPILLALAGCLTANFLSELGNTMGDNTTSVLCLASLAVIVSRWDSLAKGGAGATTLVAAGALVGLAVGLKLTNAVHALALLVAFAAYPASASARLRMMATFGAGCALGAVVTGGYWHYEMWRTYGNPLFPQFGNLFPNPLGSSLGVADMRWHPKGWGERLAWPFIISADSKRVGELPVRQVIWAFVYLAFIAGAIAWLIRRRTARPPMDPRRRYVTIVVGAGFLAWMFVFSVYRYLVPLELLAPLVVYILATHTFGRAGAKVAAYSLAFCTLIVLAGGMKTWGHADWGDAPFRIEAPRLERPASTTVIVAGGSTAWAWLALGFPREVAFTQAGGNFPEGPAFRPRMKALVSRGPAFAVVTAHRDSSGERGRSMRNFVEWTGLTRTAAGCGLLAWIADVTRPRFIVVADPVGESGACAVAPRRDAGRDVPVENRFEREQAAKILAGYGFRLDTDACELRDAMLSGEHRVYQWCPVTVLP